MWNILKKILIVSTIEDTISAFLIPQIKLLISMGYKVDIASNNKNHRKTIPNNLINERFNIPFSRNPLSINNLVAYFKIKKIINSNNYNIMNTNTPIASSISRLAIKKNSSIKVLYTVHGFHFYKGSSLASQFYRLIERLFVKKTQVFVTMNEEDFKYARDKMKSKKVFKVPGVGVDLGRFSDLSNYNIKTQDECLVLLSIGEINKNKNHLNVIKAIKKIEDKNVIYNIIGTGKEEIKLQSYIRKKNLMSKVVFLGYQNDIIPYLNKCDIFVFPSYREGLSVALMEAMAAKKPVLCSEIRGNVDLIDKDKGGLYFNPHKVNDIYEKIMEAINNVDLERFGDYNYSKIKSFSIESSLSEWKSIYNEIANMDK